MQELVKGGWANVRGYGCGPMWDYGRSFCYISPQLGVISKELKSSKNSIKRAHHIPVVVKHKPVKSPGCFESAVLPNTRGVALTVSYFVGLSGSAETACASIYKLSPAHPLHEQELAKDTELPKLLINLTWVRGRRICRFRATGSASKRIKHRPLSFRHRDGTSWSNRICNLEQIYLSLAGTVRSAQGLDWEGK